jgi:hypothetical protein
MSPPRTPDAPDDDIPELLPDPIPPEEAVKNIEEKGEPFDGNFA